MILSLFALSIATANLPAPDGVAALVGDQPILVSEVKEALRFQEQSNPALASLPGATRCDKVLGQLIDEKVILAKAKAETLDVSESEVSQLVERRVAEMTERAGGQEALLNVLRQRGNLSMGQYRLRMSRQLKEERLKEKIRDKYVAKSEPVREEVLSFYRQYKDSMPMMPDQVKLSQIVVKFTVDPSRETEALAQANKTITRLRAGEEFAKLARELSQDPGSRDSGGDIGFMKRGELDPAYEKAALNLEAGRFTQGSVRSRFGWHVIELVQKHDQDFRTRHILFALMPNSTDSARTKDRADSLRRVAMSGADFSELARKHSSEKSTASFGGVLGWYPEGELQGQFKDIIAGIATGKVGQPIPTPDGLILLRVDERVQSRRLTPEEDWTRLSQMAGQFLGGQKLEKFVTRWKEEVPVSRRIAAEEIARRIGL
jgi:peptidyl-prolyl cis-trans isomerase SurA